MIFQESKLAAGLYIVATPIGNARDITLRALDVLASADAIAAEDTRTARKLMEIHGVPLNGRRIIAYHDHSTPKERARLVALAQDGASIALISEAGTPLVSDPGYGLVSDMADQNIMTTAVPGASAALAALCVSGLPSDSFTFGGFLPTKSETRRKKLIELAQHGTTLMLYESPRRVEGLLSDIVQTLGETRPVVLCRELTKKFEEIRRGEAAELLEQVRSDSVRGECVLLIGRAEGLEIPGDENVKLALTEAMQTMRVKDAATVVAGSMGIPRRHVYQIALAMKDKR